MQLPDCGSTYTERVAKADRAAVIVAVVLVVALAVLLLVMLVVALLVVLVVVAAAKQFPPVPASLLQCPAASS